MPTQGNASSPVPKDHPMMRAWEAFKATPDYANIMQWAQHVEIVQQRETRILTALVPHAEGQLWAAFVEGWEAALRWPITNRATQRAISGGEEGGPSQR